MSRATYVQPRHGDQNDSKMAVPRPFSVENLSEQTQYYEGDHNSRPNTPSMTNGSSRSNSSSIITCDTCGMSGNHCTCTSCSDSESIRVLNSEEWTRSPRSSPALIGHHGQGKVSSQGPRLRQLNRLPYPKPTSKAIISLPENDHHLEVDSDIRQSVKVASPTGKQYSPSHLVDHNTPSPLAAPPETLGSGSNMECLTSDSEAEDDEDDSGDDEEGDEDDDWSGQDSNLEAIILEAVGDDLPLAAHLIPILHRALRSDFAINANEKLGSWRYGVCKSAAQGSGAGGEQSSHDYTTDPTNNPRKRQRRQGSSKAQSRKIDDFDEDDDEDDDDDPQESKDMEDDNGTGSQQPLPRLACPFNKRFPDKYSIQHGDVEGSGKAKYRTCEGPGFKNIQRLKEHLKRKHYPVQCERCYQIFQSSTSDRAVCVLELQSHRQLPVPCERRSPSEKEGISDAQWANLDKKKSNKKSQLTSRVALWMEYWNILFPGIPQPATPWYDNQISNRMLKPTSEDVRRFAVLFQSMLNHKVNQQYIRFLEGQEDEMKARVENLAYQTFSLLLGLNDSPSVTNSSSSRTRSGQQSSMLGGSYQHLLTPRTSRGQHSSSNSRSTAAQSEAYSMDVASSPVAHPMAARSLSQGHPSRMPPPFSTMPRMPTQTFTPTTMPSPMPNEQQTHGGFHSTMPGTMENFNGDLFVDNGIGAGSSQWDMDFNAGNPSFYGSHPAPNLNSASFVNIPRSPLDQILDPSEDNGGNLRDLRTFDQYPSTGNLHYDGTQQ